MILCLYVNDLNEFYMIIEHVLDVGKWSGLCMIEG
jgi:hypothetical protein